MRARVGAKAKCGNQVPEMQIAKMERKAQNQMTNPPAFPVHFIDREGDLRTEEQGMTLRDYFAGKALGKMSYLSSVENMQEAASQVATASYIFADAMLAERQKTK